MESGVGAKRQNGPWSSVERALELAPFFHPEIREVSMFVLEEFVRYLPDIYADLVIWDEDELQPQQAPDTALPPSNQESDKAEEYVLEPPHGVLMEYIMWSFVKSVERELHQKPMEFEQALANGDLQIVVTRDGISIKGSKEYVKGFLDFPLGLLGLDVQEDIITKFERLFLHIEPVTYEFEDGDSTVVTPAIEIKLEGIAKEQPGANGGAEPKEAQTGAQDTERAEKTEPLIGIDIYLTPEEQIDIELVDLNDQLSEHKVRILNALAKERQHLEKRLEALQPVHQIVYFHRLGLLTEEKAAEMISKQIKSHYGPFRRFISEQGIISFQRWMDKLTAVEHEGQAGAGATESTEGPGVQQINSAVRDFVVERFKAVVKTESPHRVFAKALKDVFQELESILESHVEDFPFESIPEELKRAIIASEPVAEVLLGVLVRLYVEGDSQSTAMDGTGEGPTSTEITRETIKNILARVFFHLLTEDVNSDIRRSPDIRSKPLWVVHEAVINRLSEAWKEDMIFRVLDTAVLGINEYAGSLNVEPRQLLLELVRASIALESFSLNENGSSGFEDYAPLSRWVYMLVEAINQVVRTPDNEAFSVFGLTEKYKAGEELYRVNLPGDVAEDRLTRLLQHVGSGLKNVESRKRFAKGMGRFQKEFIAVYNAAQRRMLDEASSRIQGIPGLLSRLHNGALEHLKEALMSLYEGAVQLQKDAVKLVEQDASPKLIAAYQKAYELHVMVIKGILQNLLEAAGLTFARIDDSYEKDGDVTTYHMLWLALEQWRVAPDSTLKIAAPILLAEIGEGELTSWSFIQDLSLVFKISGTQVGVEPTQVVQGEPQTLGDVVNQLADRVQNGVKQLLGAESAHA